MKLIVSFISISVVLLFVGCGGKSNATGDVVPIDKVCAYEKWKTVAVEGYIAPLSMVCEKASRKKNSGIAWCFFKVYADQELNGPYISVQIPTTDALTAKNNHMESPPERAEDLRIYDNDGNTIPLNSKVRVFGELPKSDICEFGLAKRIDRIL